ncbi:MAG: PAS domain S-box protein [Bacteroidetes bacterium]|nr:PAS domain S-box protein [Bacteroidota bacterium]
MVRAEAKERQLRKLSLIAQFNLLALVLLSSISLIGWLTETWGLLNPVGYTIPIQPLTLLQFLLLALASWAWVWWNLPVRYYKALLVLLLLSSVCILLDKTIGLSFHVDRLLLFREVSRHPDSTALKGMSPVTAGNFILTIISLGLQIVNRSARLREFINFAVILVSVVVLMAYLYRVPERPAFFLMAPMTAILFILFSVFVLLCRPGAGWINELFVKSFYSRAQLLIPLSILFPIALGYLRLQGEWYRLISPELGVTFIILTFSIVSFVATVIVARSYNQRADMADTNLEQAQDLAASNEEMQALTEELQTTNEELMSNLEALGASNRDLELANQTIAKQKDEMLNRVLDSTKDVIWSFDLTGKGESYLSRSAERVYKEPYESLIKRPYFWTDHVLEEDKAIKKASQETLARTGHTTCTYRILIDDQIRWFRDELTLIKDEKGMPVRLEGIASDITEYHQAEEKILYERNLLRALIDNIPSYIFLRDTSLKTILSNRATFELLGATREEEVLGRTLIDYYGDSAADLFEEEKKVLATGQPLINREVTVNVAGREILLSTSKVPIKDSNGEVVQVLGISHDITDLRKQENELRQYRENLEIIFHHTTDIFALMDNEAKLVVLNEPMENYISKYTKAVASPGISFYDIIAPNRHEEVKKLIARVLSGERIRVLSESIFEHETKYYDVVYAPVYKEGKVTHFTVSSADVTEKILTERENERYRTNLDIYFRTTKDNILLINAEGKVELFNQAFQKFIKDNLGVEANIGCDFLDVVIPARRPEATELFRKAIKGTASTVEAKVNGTDGGLVYHFVRYEPIARDGKITHVSLTGVDITDFKRIEEELKRDQYFLDKASESARIGYWTSHPGGKDGKLTWSKEVFKIFGMREEDFDGLTSTFFRHVHPEDLDKVITSRTLALKQKTTMDVDHRIVQPDGTVRWVNEKAQAIENEKGEIIMVGIVQDINDRKLYESVLREYNERFEILSRATNDAIWDLDIERNVETWNHGLETIFGYKQREIIEAKRWWREKIHPDDYPRVMQEMNDMFRQHTTNWTTEYRYQCADGTFKNVLDRAYIIYKDRNPVRMIGAMQDVTEITNYRLNLEQIIEERTNQLNEALQKEKELVDLKSKFISIASHEFRTPLTSISLSAGFLRRYSNKLDQASMEKKVGTIEKQVLHMNSLLEDVLLVGKLEEGKVVVNRQEYEPDLIKSLAEEAMFAKNDGRHSLLYLVKGKARPFISDEKLLRNIIYNLITNAVKFSPKAEMVTMTVRFTDDQLVMAVKDEGIGIPPDEMKNLFTSFSRATNATTIEGTGLGLHIVKSATEMLHGRVEVASELNKGTVFTIYLPLH